MASVFLRRFTFDPGDTVLVNIESVNILDLTPPAPIAGVGVGTALLVGEFENGPYNTAQQVLNSTDLQQTWGTLGYQYGSVPANYPSAVRRSADNAVVAETWNGNGYLALAGKAFASLLLCRVDTSVGSVNFTRVAAATGVAQFRYALQSGQTLTIDINGTGSDYTATFTGAAAVRSASGGTYPTAFTGVETLTLGYDDAPNFTVFFQDADESEAQVIARINQFAGFTFADNNGGQVRLTGRQAGTGGQVRVVAASSGVLTKLGLTAAVTTGTGNVANITAVAASEVKTIVDAVLFGTGAYVEFDSAGNPRVVNAGVANLPQYVFIHNSSTAIGLGFVPDVVNTADGRGTLLGAESATFPTTFAGGESITLRDTSLPGDVTVSFTSGDQTQAQVISRINTAFAPRVVAYANTIAGLALTSILPGGTISVVAADDPGTLTTLGLSTSMTATGTLPPASSLPAGTLVQNVPGAGSAPTLYVTTQDVQVTPQSVGPYAARVRHAVDDGTGTATGAGLVSRISSPPAGSAFTVTNPSPTTVALTESQVDAAYAVAISRCQSITSVAKTANVIWAARHSNATRRALRTSAIQASANGCFGRLALVSPPLNTSPQVALSTTAEPGIGAYRDERVLYCYVGANVSVPLIGLRGLAGGTGFTADGTIDQTSDGWMATILSQLPPEENPGQDTPFTSNVNSIERGANVQGFEMDTYSAFKQAGIAALRFDSDTGHAIFQSGVTSVDPLVNPGMVRIARRRMADYIQDSISKFASGFGKKLGTFRRKKAISNGINAFLGGLLGANNPGSQRIDGYTPCRDVTTLAQQGLGIFRLVVTVRTLTSLDSIVIATEVGDTVTVTTTLPQAA